MTKSNEGSEVAATLNSDIGMETWSEERRYDSIWKQRVSGGGMDKVGQRGRSGVMKRAWQKAARAAGAT